MNNKFKELTIDVELKLYILTVVEAVEFLNNKKSMTNEMIESPKIPLMLIMD